MRASEGKPGRAATATERVLRRRDRGWFPDLPEIRQLHDTGRREGCRAAARRRPGDKRSLFAQRPVLRREDQGVQSGGQGVRLPGARTAKVSDSHVKITRSNKRLVLYRSTAKLK